VSDGGDAAALALLLLRGVVGVVVLAHGVNHVLGGGKIAGTAGWFGSLGMRAPRLQAWLASGVEIASGLLLLVGLLTPLAAAGVVGVMAVAGIINHRGNGFFIFRPGEGWEYVLVLGVAGVALGGLGAGAWSLDAALDLFHPPGWAGLGIAAGAGLGGAAALLALAWRPAPRG
jgi:putative oxidoreductase